MPEHQIILVVESKPLFQGAADQLEANYYKGRVQDRQEFGDAENAKEYMQRRLKMHDGEEYSYVVVGFKDGNFSDVVNRMGEPVVKYKGTITPKKKLDDKK